MKKPLYISLFKLPHIYFLKDNKWIHAFLFFLLSMVLLVFPISLNLINSKTTNYELLGAKLALEDVEGLLDELPNFSIASGRLIYADELKDQVISTNLENSFVIILNTTSTKYKDFDQSINTVIFSESSFDIYIAGANFTYDYARFSNMHVTDLKNLDSSSAVKVIYDNIYLSLKSTFLFPVILILVAVFFGMNLIYIIIIAMFARLLRIRDNNVPIYSEILKIAMFASLLPSIISMIIGLFAPPLTIVFYNFGLPLMLVLIYFKSKAIQINNNYINQKDVEFIQ